MKDGKAEAIYDLDEFVSRFAGIDDDYLAKGDEFFDFCNTNPTYDEALAKYSERLFEAELNGEVEIHNGRVFLSS